MPTRSELSSTPTSLEAGLREAYTGYHRAYLRVLTSRGLCNIIDSTNVMGYEPVLKIDVTNVQLPSGLDEQIGGLYGYGDKFCSNPISATSLVFKPNKVEIETWSLLLTSTQDGKFYFPPHGSKTSQLVSSGFSINFRKQIGGFKDVVMVYHILDRDKPQISTVDGKDVDNRKEQILKLPLDISIGLIKGFTAVLKKIEIDRETPVIIQPITTLY